MYLPTTVKSTIEYPEYDQVLKILLEDGLGNLSLIEKIQNEEGIGIGDIANYKSNLETLKAKLEAFTSGDEKLKKCIANLEGSMSKWTDIFKRFREICKHSMKITDVILSLNK